MFSISSSGLTEKMSKKLGQENTNKLYDDDIKRPPNYLSDDIKELMQARIERADKMRSALEREQFEEPESYLIGELTHFSDWPDDVNNIESRMALTGYVSALNNYIHPERLKVVGQIVDQQKRPHNAWPTK